MNNIIIAPSILSADFTQLGNQIHQIEQAGVDWVHVDVMDGHFVPNISMGPFIVEACRKVTDLPIDAHLMIENPEKYVEAFAKAGANWISIHIENNNNVMRTIQSIRTLGCHPGIVLNPGTPACSASAVLPFVDYALIMTVNPGYSGQSYIREMEMKIAEVAKMKEKLNPNLIIEVDGGIVESTLAATYQAGARAFVAGHGVFRHPAGIHAAVQSLRNAVP